MPWHHHLFGSTIGPNFQGVKYVKLDRILKQTDWICGLFHIFLWIFAQFTVSAWIEPRGSILRSRFLGGVQFKFMLPGVLFKNMRFYWLLADKLIIFARILHMFASALGALKSFLWKGPIVGVNPLLPKWIISIFLISILIPEMKKLHKKIGMLKWFEFCLLFKLFWNF